MNIKEAKETITHTLQAYFQKEENGYPLVPLRQQRPILMIGPPGIGKTAIMEQIAGECGAGLVAYTMTHHTRQSAMGLPKIVERTFGDTQVSVTEYTMSEIIASIYMCMERTGKKRGILFLDEINCVSETLAPVMLQLLQDKTFGNQKLPPDWLRQATRRNTTNPSGNLTSRRWTVSERSCWSRISMSGWNMHCSIRYMEVSGRIWKHTEIASTGSVRRTEKNSL